jgi:hypothetical protein
MPTSIIIMEEDLNFCSNIRFYKTIFNKLYQSYFNEEVDAEVCNFSCIDVHKAWRRSQLDPEHVAFNKLMKSQ